MRIDRLAGAISSPPCKDFDLVCLVEDVGSESLMERSRSDSDSDDIPDEDEDEECVFDGLVEALMPDALFPLFNPFNPPAPSSVDDIPRA